MGFRAGLARAEKIIFAYPSPSTSFLPLVGGAKESFFDPENLQPELVQIRPAVAIPGLTLGSVDYTTVLGSTIAARMRGVPLVITGVFADKPMDFLVGAKGIASAKDLKGKIIGISALGTATHFLTVRVLKAVGSRPGKGCDPARGGRRGTTLAGARARGLVQASLLGSQGVIEGEKAGLKVIVAAADVIDESAFRRRQPRPWPNSKKIPSRSRVLRAGLRGLRYVQDNKAGTVDVIQSWYRVEREMAAVDLRPGAQVF